MNGEIRILLVDDHPLFREGVAYTLAAEPDMVVAGQGEDVAGAVRLVRDLAPDVLLLDLNIPGGGGITAAREIAALAPEVKIIMLTASVDEDDLAAAMAAGAKGYILKGVAARELVSIVRAVWAGQGYVAPSLAAGLLAGLTRERNTDRPAADPLESLTDRERQVLALVGHGLSNKEIGERLHLSEKTVKHYMTIIMEKLGVRNRVEAAMIVGKTEPGGIGQAG